MVLNNINRVKDKVRKAASKSGRRSEDIKILAITKNVDAGLMREAVNLGMVDLGENRIQEIRSKIPYLKDLNISWHMVGHLQRNKVKYAVDIFEYIHSLDSIRLAEAIDGYSKIKKKNQKVFIEVNTSREEAKFGVDIDSVESLVYRVIELDNLDLMGFMTVAPFTKDKDMVRESFKKLREIRDGVSEKNNKKLYLSMGMSDDFEIAIEEGADFIRLGRAIFGERL